MRKSVLVTGSAGLIGSYSVRFFCDKGFDVVGIDNDSRSYFFGPKASTIKNKQFLKNSYKNYTHYSVDIRNQKQIEEIFKRHKFSLIIHTAAQPSHDWAAKEPLTDFTINALGTHILLESYRKYCPKAVFIFTSTNKVYGNNPNKIPLYEDETRYELLEDHQYFQGIDESMPIDNCVHSIFGVSKAAADLMVQEYGKYFGLKTGVFRGGCLTGPAHTPSQLHGFLAYLVHSVVNGIPYTIFGYKGKQVRDNIHAYDVVNAFYQFYLNPKEGEAYNIGGSRFSNISITEALKKVEELSHTKAKKKYVHTNRTGDHIWYISDVSKLKKHLPDWNYSYDIDQILKELVEEAKDKISKNKIFK